MGVVMNSEARKRSVTPEPDAGLTGVVAKVLAEHGALGYDDIDGCECGADVRTHDDHRAHVADLIAALLSERDGEADEVAACDRGPCWKGAGHDGRCDPGPGRAQTPPETDEAEALADVVLTDAERRLLADRVLGGSEPSSLLVRAVGSIVADRLAARAQVEASSDEVLVIRTEGDGSPMDGLLNHFGVRGNFETSGPDHAVPAAAESSLSSRESGGEQSGSEPASRDVGTSADEVEALASMLGEADSNKVLRPEFWKRVAGHVIAAGYSSRATAPEPGLAERVAALADEWERDAPLCSDEEESVRGSLVRELRSLLAPAPALEADRG